ncbi:MAG: caspase family protein, partial [Asticcacaulis sp.]
MMPRLTLLTVFAAVLLWLGLSLPASADTTPRLALIINQVDYQTLTPLPDTDGEAGDIKASLVKLGFDVTTARDISVQATPGHPSFRQVLDDFRLKVSQAPGAIVFIYYTGHGMHDPTDESGENYLLGTDANIRVPADLPPSGIRLSDLTGNFSRAGTKALIVVLDACRDTPSLGKGVSKGLAAVAPQENTLIAYSTSEGHIAETGVYAPVLAQELLQPGDLGDIFNHVQAKVADATAQKQHPWANNDLYQVVCLVSCTVNIPAQPATVDVDWQKEQAVWASVHDCTDLQSYMAQYPNGAFATQARGRLSAPPCVAAPVNTVPVQSTPPVVADTTPAAPPAASLAGSKLAAVAPPPWYDDDSEMLVDSCDSDANADHDGDRVPGALAVLDRDVKPAKAVADCRRALDKYGDNRHLAYNLGRAYELNKDYANAKVWYGQAAVAGSGAAMYGMGNLYFAGEGVNKDPAQAIAWFQKGAAAGNSESMLYLGILYDSGMTGDDDKANAAQARKWYQAAIAAGNTGAQELLDMMPKGG